MPVRVVENRFRGRLGGHRGGVMHHGAVAGRTAVARDGVRCVNRAGRLGAMQRGKVSGGYRRLDRGRMHARTGASGVAAGRAWCDGAAVDDKKGLGESGMPIPCAVEAAPDVPSVVGGSQKSPAVVIWCCWRADATRLERGTGVQRWAAARIHPRMPRCGWMSWITNCRRG